MNLKLLLKKRGMTQLELSKQMKLHPATLNMQMNLHRMLPEKHLEKFCRLLEIDKADLVKAMNVEGGINE